MLDWLFDLSTLALMGLFTMLFVGFAWVGIIFVRPFLRLIVQGQRNLNGLVGNMLEFYSVIYGLLLGLLAVGAYQNYLDVSAAVLQEASEVIGLARAVESFPEPLDQELRSHLIEYARSTIEEEWPQLQVGVVPLGANPAAAAIQETMFTFEPTTVGEEILLDKAVTSYYQLLSFRRLRLYGATIQLPTVLWYVVVMGGFLTIVLVWLFDMKVTLHFVLGGLLAFFIGTMIALILELDNPFRGQLSVTADPFILVYRSLTGQ